MQSQNDKMISVRFQGKPFNITGIQVYAPTSNAEEAEVERFYVSKKVMYVEVLRHIHLQTWRYVFWFSGYYVFNLALQLDILKVI